MNSRYDRQEKRPSEQEEWEKNQQKMTQYAIGAQDKKSGGEEYSYVEQTEIEFIEDLQSGRFS